jgi:hypothetical protein
MDVIELAERAIDSSIRGFNPQNSDSYYTLDRELKSAEDALRDMPEADLRALVSVRAERIRIASEVGRFGFVLEETANLLYDFPPSTPVFFIVTARRLMALHETGRHEEEIQEALQYAAIPELRGSEYLYLLADLSRRHPGRLPADDDLWLKLEESIETLRALGYDTLPQTTAGPAHLEQLAVSAANELGRINWERGEALLRDFS